MGFPSAGRPQVALERPVRHWRDPIHAVFAVHVSLLVLLAAALGSCITPYLWLTDAQRNAQVAWVLAWLGLGWMAVLVQELTAELGKRSVTAVLRVHALCCLSAAAAWALADEPIRGVGGPLLATGFLLLAPVLAWYCMRRPQVGWWVLSGWGLLAGAGAALLMPAVDWRSDAARLGVPLAAALEIALVFAGLRVRGRARREARDRLEAIARTDPLTGVGNQRALLERLDALLHRSAHHSPGAVLRVRVTNLDLILEQYGREAAEAAVMRAAECVTREAGAQHSVAREQGGDLIMVLEGQVSHAQAAEAARNIIARGLKFSSWLPPQVTLTLHVAALCGPLPATDAASLLATLGRGVAQIGRERQGKAIRFVDSEPPALEVRRRRRPSALLANRTRSISSSAARSAGFSVNR